MLCLTIAVRPLFFSVFRHLHTGTTYPSLVSQSVALSTCTTAPASPAQPVHLGKPPPLPRTRFLCQACQEETPARGCWWRATGATCRKWVSVKGRPPLSLNMIQEYHHHQKGLQVVNTAMDYKTSSREPSFNFHLSLHHHQPTTSSPYHSTTTITTTTTSSLLFTSSLQPFHSSRAL